MKQFFLLLITAFIFPNLIEAQTYKMKIEKTDGETIIIPVNTIDRISYITNNGDDNNDNDNSSQIQLLMNGIWQLYSEWYHYSYWDYDMETKYFEYVQGEPSGGYRMRFNNDGFYDSWDWNGHVWEQKYRKPYKVNGNQLTVFWDNSSDGSWNEEVDDNTIGTFTIDGNTLTYEGVMQENDEGITYTYSFKNVYKRVSL